MNTFSSLKLKSDDEDLTCLKTQIIELSDDIEKKQSKLKILLFKLFMSNVKSFLVLDLDTHKDHYDTIKFFYFSGPNELNLINNRKDKLAAQNKENWKCMYIHETSQYTSNNYCINSESENENILPYFKKTKISFGYKNNKYFMKGANEGIRLFTSQRLPNLYSSEYEYETNLDEYEIMNCYSKNKNTPEWLLIKIFLQIRRHSYYPEKFIKFFKS